MNRKVFTLFSIFILLVSMALAQFPVKRKAGIYRVIARSGLNMRDASSLSGQTIAKIPYGSEVQLIDEGYELITVGWMKGYWARINYEGKKGYVFGPYITHLPLPNIKMDGNCGGEYEVYGYETMLISYIKEHLKKDGEARVIYKTPPHVEENHRSVELQWYEENIQVLKTIFYESGSTALRVPGTDIFQAFAFLEAMAKPCTKMQPLFKNPEFVKDKEGNIVEIRDAEYSGYNFRIRQIDAVTAEILMASGV